jgi:hypothetical protein
VAQFLASHQHCDVGIDVTRDQGPGSGRLKITCKGCGESVEYLAAEAAEMAGGPPIENGETLANRAELTPAPSPTPVPHVRRSPDGQQGEFPPRRGLPSWLPMVLFTAVIIISIGLLVVGLMRSDSSPQDAAPSLQRHEFIGRFAIGVPPGWRRTSPGGNVVLTAPAGDAQIRISDDPARASAELSGHPADFLADQHPQSTISKPRRVRLGDGTGIEVRAVYEGGEEIAALISAGGDSFLIAFSKQNDADERVVQEGEASFASFRPR